MVLVDEGKLMTSLDVGLIWTLDDAGLKLCAR